MFESIKNLFGSEKTDYAQLVKAGAVILDVRTTGEYAGGHINGSLNISLDQLPNNLHRFTDKKQPIITCCASGMRSASAASLLKSKGYTHVFNAGGWSSLKTKLK